MHASIIVSFNISKSTLLEKSDESKILANLSGTLQQKDIESRTPLVEDFFRIKINVKSHNIFHRDGQNLIMDAKIKLSDAILGADFIVPALDGDITVKIPEGISHGELLRVRERGVPSKNGRRGDILIRILVDFPKKLSKRQKEIINEMKEEGL